MERDLGRLHVAEILEALRDTTARVIDESRQLRAKSEELIEKSQRLRRGRRELAAKDWETTVPARLAA